MTPERSKLIDIVEYIAYQVPLIDLTFELKLVFTMALDGLGWSYSVNGVDGSLIINKK